MPHSTLVRKALDKVSSLVAKKNLSSGSGQIDQKKSSVYRSVKIPNLPCAVEAQKDCVNSSFKTPLKTKTHHVLSDTTDPSPLASQALIVSSFCQNERKLQNLLLTLREREVAGIAPTRCTVWRFREKYLAQVTFKNMRNVNSANREHAFTNLSTKEVVRKDSSAKEEKANWQEISRRDEERHFHLNRVIKYLSK